VDNYVGNVYNGHVKNLSFTNYFIKNIF